MMVVHHESLPASYLLVLAPDPVDESERELVHHLGEACRSGKAAVWLDCRLLDGISTAAKKSGKLYFTKKTATYDSALLLDP